MHGSSCVKGNEYLAVDFGLERLSRRVNTAVGPGAAGRGSRKGGELGLSRAEGGKVGYGQEPETEIGGTRHQVGGGNAIRDQRESHHPRRKVRPRGRARTSGEKRNSKQPLERCGGN